MAEIFNGTWKQKGPSEGVEEFCKGVGLPDQTIEVYKKASLTLTFANKGDTVSVDVDISGLGSKNFTCKFGEEYNTTGVDGKPAKIKAAFEDGKLVDYAKSESSNKPILTIRSLDSTKKIMTQINKTADGEFSMTTIFEKC